MMTRKEREEGVRGGYKERWKKGGREGLKAEGGGKRAL